MDRLRYMTELRSVDIGMISLIMISDDEYIQICLYLGVDSATVVTVKFDVIYYIIALMLEGSSSYSGNIDWNDIIKKEARGINNEDLGEVQEVTQDYVLVEKGIINKEKFYIPRDLAVGYNGIILIFNLSIEDAKNKFLRDSPPVLSQSQLTGGDASISGDLVIVPVMAERLEVTKKESSQEARIIKEAITEVKTVEVPLAHDELYIETRPLGDKNEQQATGISVQSDIPTQEEVGTLFIRAEVPEVLRRYHMKEEIVVKKKISTETRKITEQLRGERVSIEGATPEILEAETMTGNQMEGNQMT
jgi:uncharacterized protein (TIGR02271 family)